MKDKRDLGEDRPGQSGLTDTDTNVDDELESDDLEDTDVDDSDTDGVEDAGGAP